MPPDRPAYRLAGDDPRASETDPFRLVFIGLRRFYSCFATFLTPQHYHHNECRIAPGRCSQFTLVSVPPSLPDSICSSQPTMPWLNEFR
jgi:hypothetical protein